MKTGDIARVKISGENVYITKQMIDGGFEVHRAVVTGQGIRHYTYETFRPEELETPEENIDREFKEAIYRQTLMAKHIEEQEQIEDAVDAVDMKVQ